MESPEILPQKNGPQRGATISRRNFVRTLAAVSAAAPARLSWTGQVFGAENSSRTPVGSNIYGWGQYYQRMGKNVGEHLDEVLSALRDADYDYLEAFVDSNQPDKNAELAERTKAKGLKPVCLYTGGRLHEPGRWEPVVEKLLAAARVCHKAGFSIIDCNPDPIGREKTGEELKAQALALAAFGKGLREMGMKLGVHNHTPEMVNNAREFHHNFRQTDPKDVGFCFDVHWVFRGGVKPLEALDAYGARVVSWHLRQSRNGTWHEILEDGDIDYKAVAQRAAELKLQAPYTVELAIEPGTKITRTVVENHRLSREFVRKVFAV
ncbi:MAG: sugar phosphate isomerase/epimerase [Verrucomicrobiota bacterium]